MLFRSGISVVIPNFNGENILPVIMPSVFNSLLFTNVPFEIIVADDCSTDNSVLFLRNTYPEIIIIESDENLGFAPTINKGIFLAKNDLVFLLNNDVKISKDYFVHQFRYFEKEDTFGVMGRIIGWDDDNIQDGAKYPEIGRAHV